MPPLDARGQKAEPSLYEQIGGHATLARVHKIFYDKLYAHYWLKLFFLDIDQTTIENQQTDFIAQAMGGPAVYCGKFPVPAHKHMYITAEMFDLRHSLLEAALCEAGITDALRARWLKIDGAFRGSLVKASPAECAGRFNTDPIMVIPKPAA